MAATLARKSCLMINGFQAVVAKCCCPSTSLNALRMQLRTTIQLYRPGFPALILLLSIAAMESGADIRFNPRLEKLIERARSISMPKEKIESAIKSGAGTKDNPYEASMLEIKGPGGCGLIVQILTSSKVKTKNEINTILRKNGGLLKDGGSVTFQYDHKGVIATEDFLFTGDKHDLSDYPDKDTLDKAEEIAIEIGAENLFFYESESGARNIKFICPVEDTKQVYDQLTEKFPKEVISSELEYVPHTLVSLPNELLQQTAKLIETLEDHIDVVRVYDNIEQYQSTTCKLFGST